MAEVRDDPMLFSLRGLLHLERQRLERESNERRRQEEFALALERERARICREAEDRRRQAMVEAARLEAQRRREEEARLVALRQASVERARVEAESQARLELVEKQQAHERVLAELREETRNRRARHLALAGFVLFGISLCASAALYFGKLRPEAARLGRAYDQLVAAEHNRAEETQRMLERAEKKKGELETELDQVEKRITTLESKKTTNAVPKPTPKQPRRP
jgi:colicin import membrane protein